MELLHDAVSRQAEQLGSKTAIVMGEERLSYEELEERSNRLARVLQEAGVGQGDRVAFLLPKSPAAIVAMLAILKCDAAYVPLDTGSPAPRLSRILTKADPGLLLAGGGTGKLLPQLLESLPPEAGSGSQGLSIGWLGPEPPSQALILAFGPEDLSGPSGDPVRGESRPDDLAHILFTSGSTGMPKGVVITHQNAMGFIRWAQDYFGLSKGDRTSGHSPFHFDLSTFDIFGSLSAGAELHLVSPRANLLPSALTKLIRDAELTQWFSVPSAMGYMASAGVIRGGDFPTLKRVLWCGEVLPTPVLMHWMERVPHPTYTNLYGPTEATIASTYYTVPEIPTDPTEPVPIGAPCGGEDVLVLRENLSPAATGEVGDIFIAGDGLSPGYWRDPGKTEAAFIQAPPELAVRGTRLYRTGDLGRMDEEGCLHFLGRADTQIKSRGHRIELGEIEAALGGIPELAEFAVVAVPADGFEGMTICCAYSVSGADPVEPRAVKGRLRESLPAYMLPQSWLPMDKLPKNANGKIDRKALKERFSGEAHTS